MSFNVGVQTKIKHSPKKEIFFELFAKKFLGFKDGLKFLYYAFTFNMYNNDKKQVIYALENKKRFSTFLSYLLRIKNLIQNNKYKKIKHLIFIGDSHLLNYEYLFLNNYFSSFIVLFCRIQGASTYGLKKKNSKSGALKIIKKIINKKQGNPEIFLNFGEVDCRSTFWLVKNKNKKNIHEVLKIAILNYKNLIVWIKDKSYKNITLVGVHKPVWKENNIWTKKFENYKSILQITNEFNKNLKILSKELNCNYFDINKEMNLKKIESLEEFAALKGEHHLNPEKTANIFYKKINNLILQK